MPFGTVAFDPSGPNRADATGGADIALVRTNANTGIAVKDIPGIAVFLDPQAAVGELMLSAGYPGDLANGDRMYAMGGAVAGNGLAGGDGADRLGGEGGDDIIVGGAGTDTAVFAGNRSDYAVAYDEGTQTFTVTDRRGGAPDGIDEISETELFEFADGTFDPASLVGNAPTDIVVTGGTVNENAAAGTVVATLAAVDPDAGDTHTYGIVGASSAFEISGNEVRVKPGAAIDYEAATSRNITVRTTDAGGATFDKPIAIAVANVNEAPTNATLSGGSAAENAANGTVVGAVAGVDPDAGATFTYALTDAAGGRSRSTRPAARSRSPTDRCSISKPPRRTP